MTKLGQLREAEEKAQQEIDRAEKEAQRIRLSLPDLKEDQNREKTEKLRELARKEEEQVDRKVAALSEQLQNETADRLRQLAERKDQLEIAARERLSGIILKSGER